MKNNIPLIIGHRGACGYEPENTMLSFQRAVEMKAGMIEMDVYICKSGEPVIIHDITVNRTTNGSGYIRDLTLDDIKKLDAGKGQKLPALWEVLDSFSNININLELKGEDTAKPVYDIIEKYIRQGKWKEESFYISSFNHYVLKEFINTIPPDSGIKICPLTAGLPLGFAEFAEPLNAYSVNISNEFVNRDFVNDAHKRNMKVFVYTVNDTDEYYRITSMGADGIFTDCPDLF